LKRGRVSNGVPPLWFLSGQFMYMDSKKKIQWGKFSGWEKSMWLVRLLWPSVNKQFFDKICTKFTYMNCPLKNHKGGTPLLTLPRFNSFYFYLSSISHIIPCTDLLNNYNPFCNNLLHNLSFPLHIQLSIQTSKS
jgi:hypothetical protein